METFKNETKKFEKITLDELNQTSSYLKRIDRKFLTNNEKLKDILEDLKNDFRILEINNKRVFSYDNVYMDTEDYLFYNQHQNKLKKRTKVRTRLYIDSNLAFFEYKQKENWITQKYRYSFPVEEHWTMTKWKKRFFEWVWQALYTGEKVPKIFPAIQTKYKRITLVSKDWSERLTIDFDIRINNLRNKKQKEIKLKNLVIIESKSLNKDCYSCKIIEQKHWIKQANSCSKYSLWVIYSWLAEKYDTFQDTMEEIKRIRLDTLKNRFRKTKLTNILKWNNIKETKTEKILIKK